MDLFSHTADENQMSPLAERMRPLKFAEFHGQDQIFQKNKNLIRQIEGGYLQSLILWGPPGTGKTSFARTIVTLANANTFEENAIDLGAKRIREIGIAGQRALVERQEKTVLFIDEIHRLNRGQQDCLLPFLEKGHIYLVGATTENPSYQLNSALMSRCRLIVFELHNMESLRRIAEKACSELGIDLPKLFDKDALEQVLGSSHGDARKLISLIEEIWQVHYQLQSAAFPLTSESLTNLFQNSGLRFDKSGDEHYDTISAFIKSIRGSDPDAGIYYLARMLEGGEDPLFIARRLVILASEDIGNADPQALGVAVNGLRAVELVGLPEAQINLAQVVTYLASAPKSNASYNAIKSARKFVSETGPLSIPKSLRSAGTTAMKTLGYGQGYNYAHEGDRGWQPQQFLPDEAKGKSFYEPVERGFEKRIREYLAWVKGEAKKD